MTTTTREPKGANGGAANAARDDGTRLKLQVIDVARRFAELPADSADEADRRADALRPLVERLAHGVFRLVVMGEVKKGKSSFIAALLGVPELLPNSSDVSTSTVFKILYGPKLKYTVYFLPPDPDGDGNGGTAAEPKEVSREQVNGYGSEVGNPDNRKNVDFIAVELPNPLLREGIVIVDTPGVGGLFRKHRDVTFRYLPNADAVFFVLDSVETVISADEVSFIKELGKITNQVFFVQTKIDQAGEEQWQGWRRRNLDVLAGALGRPAAKIPYFPVSSPLKQEADRLKSGPDLNDSGFLPVVQFLQQVLVPRKDGILAARAAQGLGPVVATEGRTLMDRLTIARELSKATLAAFKKELLDAQQEHRDWEVDQWRRRVRDFHDRVAELRREAQNEVQDAFGHDGPGFEAMVDGLKARFANADADAVYAASNDVLGEYAADCTRRGNGLLSDFAAEVQRAYQQAVSDGAAELQARLAAKVAVEAGEVHRDATGRLDAVRSGWMNFSMVKGLSLSVGGGVGWAVIAGVISTPVGWAIAAGAGVAGLATSIWAAVRGYKGVRERHLATAMGNLERALEHVAQRAARGTGRCLQETAADLDRHARDGFDNFVATTKAEFAKRIQDVTEAQARTADESRDAVSALGKRLAAVTAIAAEIDGICKAGPAAVPQA